VKAPGHSVSGIQAPAAAIAQVLAVVALVLLVVLFFWKLALTNLILARGDLFLYFYPYWDYRARALLEWRLPLWNPLLFMGAPFLANSQAGVYYPLNWPLAVFAAPLAVKASIVVHAALAGTGSLLFARRALGQSLPGAFLAAGLFCLGGYLTAQVEHINQLQGLAWMPWLLLAVHRHTGRVLAGSRLWPRSLLQASAIVALQLLAGHTQAAFISLSAGVLYAAVITLAAAPGMPPRFQSATMPSAATRLQARARLGPLSSIILHMLALAAIAALLAAAQLLPTFELSAQSLRGGGLSPREALSFSLDPRLLGRALLPGFSRSLFTEFVAYSGIAGLALAVLGVGRSPARLALLAVSAVGVAFALGVFNPVYGLLALAPPFNLFRVPARWLVLMAFGVAMLAGSGLDAAVRRPAWRRLAAALLLPGFLALSTPLAAGLTPAGETGPLGLPGPADVAGWLMATVAVAALLSPGMPVALRRQGLMLIAVLELFVAGQTLPYNNATAPEAYASVRPAMTQLLAAARGEVPPDRFLSMSALLFDPGDLAELRGILEPQLPLAAVEAYIVATKHKEVLSPNLPLAWNVPAVDGFDGGVLPLAHYAAFTQLFTGAISTDGRLRENLPTAPDPRLMSLVNGRWLITDKVGDAWMDGIFYDLQFAVDLEPDETAEIAVVPSFEATALGLVMDNTGGAVRVTFEDGSGIEAPASAPRLGFDRSGRPVEITLVGPMRLRGASLVDERTGAFQTLALGPFRLAHSGDVKVYENLAVLPRAFVATEWVAASDGEALAILASPSFDPGRTIILAPGAAGGAGEVDEATQPARITHYAPELVRIDAEGPGYLLLTDAYYPGWKARIDGQQVPIVRANVMFRAVMLPAGTHTVQFSYEPWPVWLGLGVSVAAWLLALLAWLRPRR
jgi:hypothetical protein